jgi:hypothetical protein
VLLNDVNNCARVGGHCTAETSHVYRIGTERQRIATLCWVSSRYKIAWEYDHERKIMRAKDCRHIKETVWLKPERSKHILNAAVKKDGQLAGKRGPVFRWMWPIVATSLTVDRCCSNCSAVFSPIICSLELTSMHFVTKTTRP